MRILLLVLAVAIAGAEASEPDLFSGDWIPEPNRAQRGVGMRPETIKIQAQGERVSLAETGTRSSGEQYSFSFVADCDGRINGIMGSPVVDAVQCWRKDARTLVIKLVRVTAPVEWRTAEVAKNGQNLKITTTVTNAQGKDEKSSATFVKK